MAQKLIIEELENFNQHNSIIGFERQKAFLNLLEKAEKKNGYCQKIGHTFFLDAGNMLTEEITAVAEKTGFAIKIRNNQFFLLNKNFE